LAETINAVMWLWTSAGQVRLGPDVYCNVTSGEIAAWVEFKALSGPQLVVLRSRIES
jgi:hypothetical protein